MASSRSVEMLSLTRFKSLIDLTDGQFGLEAIDQMKLVISQNRSYVARVALVGAASLTPEAKYWLPAYSSLPPNFSTRDDAIDFVEHDDEYLVHPPVEYKPETLTKDGRYNWALLWELLARLLRYPDDQYWITVQRCLPFFTYDRTRKARLMTNFADEIRDLSLEQLQSLYREAFNLNPACSLELSKQLHLEGRQRADMIEWIERRVGRLEIEYSFSIHSRAVPILYSPPDHISVALMLMTVTNWEEIRDGWLYPAMQNLVAAMKGSKSPFEKLAKVISLVVTPG